MSHPENYLERILTSRVYDVAVESPLEVASNLSRRLNNQILLKREDLQPVFSFKCRGAYNKMSGLSSAQLARGVVAASAGNHAQGVALAAQTLNARATIVMPATTPKIKVDAVAARGAKVILHGDSYDDAYAHAIELAKTEHATFVHPYDDPDVIAGQGTVAMELLRQHPGPIHSVYVPVGGGGLIAGMAVYIKRLRPDIKVIGVEPEDADAMARSLCKGKRITLPRVGIFADGVAVKKVGKETFRLSKLYVDEIIRVNNDAICAAIKDVFEDTRSILEPAGALSIAGLKAAIAGDKLKGKTLVAIASGANMNFDRLRHIAERAELGEKREAVLAVTIPETPGSFKNFCALLGTRNITEFNYRFFRSEDCPRLRWPVGTGGGGEHPRGRFAAAQRPQRDRPDQQRNGQAACPSPGRRARTGSGQRGALPLRVSRAPRRLDALSREHESRLEHQPVPLPQPWRGLRSRAGRYPGAGKRKTQLPEVSGRAGLPLLGRVPQSGLQAFSRLSLIS
jgi:threonine dehydratase